MEFIHESIVTEHPFRPHTPSTHGACGLRFRLKESRKMDKEHRRRHRLARDSAHVTGTQWDVKYCMRMKSPELMDLQKHVVEDVYWRR